jgi:YD repeat-containing protein
MQYYNCLSLPLIDAWCATPTTEDPELSCPVADPVYPGNGAVSLTSTDFRSGDDIAVRFTRSYRSKPLVKDVNAMGPAWFHNWQRKLDLSNANTGNTSKVLAYRENGDPVTFVWSVGYWKTADYSGLTLSQNGNQWTFTDTTTGAVETYSSNGVLQTEQNRIGFTRTLAYSGNGQLATITQHAAGHDANSDLTLRLEYDDKGRLSRLNDPMGGITQYAYDANSNLVSVSWPDGNIHRYVYDDSRFKNSITGEVDETGTRIATWVYDAQGRAISVSHPDTSRNVQFAYGDKSVAVSTSRNTTTLKMSPVAGMLRPTDTSSPSATTSSVYDASGNLLKDVTASGGTIDYSYDGVGRPTKRTVRFSQGIAVFSVRYADATSLRASQIAMPGKVQSFVYDANGNVTGFSEFKTADPTGESGFDAIATGQQRTSGLHYNSSNRIDIRLDYANGENIARWDYLYDATGNLRVAAEQKSGWTWGVMQRDAAHRPTSLAGDNREAAVAYNARGEVRKFLYNEYPTATNGGLYRFLTVNYEYAVDGRLVSRTGTAAQNSGGATTVGSPSPISDDEIDLWLNNFERGANPVAPSASRVGQLQRLLGGQQEPGLIRLCIECMFNPALGYGWAVSADNDDPFGVLALAGTIRGWVKGGDTPQCKATQVSNEELLTSANRPFKDGQTMTQAGRAATKHPEYFGYDSTEALRQTYRTTDQLNQMASDAVKNALENGVRTTGVGGRYADGWVTYTPPTGPSASFYPNGDFIGFRK